MPVCTKCGDELTNDNWSPATRLENKHICKRCANAYAANHRVEVPRNEKRKQLFTINIEQTAISQNAICNTLNDGIHILNDIRPHRHNKKCANYLGVDITEEVLSNMFKNVIKMRHGYIGYDFICNRGMKIDSKASVMRVRNKQTGQWQFNTNKNIIADYFIFLAFDDRTHLTPLHIWMMPTKYFDGVGSANISVATIDKWDEYRLPLDKVVKCCDTLR